MISPASLRTVHPGDAAKVVILAGITVYFACIAANEVGLLPPGIFSKQYLEDGFCIANKDKHFTLQSHLVSFYFDTVGAMGMVFLVTTGTNTFGFSKAATAPIKKNAYSLFGHGCGHLLLGLAAGSGGTGPVQVFETMSMPQRLAAFVIMFPVWWGFMCDSKRSKLTTALFATFHNALQVFVLPTRFFFTHVLLSVLGNSAIRWLRKPVTEKTKYYAMESWLVDVPIVLASFGEATTCEKLLLDVGGHVWFDMVVPVMFVVYFAILIATKDWQSNVITKAVAPEKTMVVNQHPRTPVVSSPLLARTRLMPRVGSTRVVTK